MSSVPVFVGLDYHSKSTQVCVLNQDGSVRSNRKVPSDVPSVLKEIDGLAVGRVAIEACCGAFVFAQDLVDSAGLRVAISHPGYVNRMKSSPDKTDRGDARILADLCRVGYVPEVWLAPPAIRELRAMVRYRDAQVRDRRAVKTRVLATLRDQRIDGPKFRRWTLGWLAWLRTDAALSETHRWIIDQLLEQLSVLTDRIKQIEAKLEEMTASDPVVQKLREIKGVGLVSASVLRAFIGRFDRFGNGKQLARFCAMTPRNSSSGDRVADAGLIKAGDPLLKTCIVQIAHSLRRWTPRWRAMAAQYAERGKPASVIIGAIGNRWIRGLHHEMVAMEAAMAA